jgi:HTH-type transcriptional regulator / antitoxin HipB
MDYPVKTPLQLRPLLVGFRKSAGLTQADMASRLGVTQQTYAQLEAKPESARMDRLFLVLAMLKVNIILNQPSEQTLPEPTPAPAGRKVSKKPAAVRVASAAGAKKREDW